MPELLQEQANGDSICRTVTRLMTPQAYQEQLDRLEETSTWLKQQSSQSAVSAVVNAWHDHLNQNLVIKSQG